MKIDMLNIYDPNLNTFLECVTRELEYFTASELWLGNDRNDRVKVIAALLTVKEYLEMRVERANTEPFFEPYD